jgi:hypothetical protein
MSGPPAGKHNRSDRDALRAAYVEWRHERRQALLRGPHADGLQELFGVLRSATMVNTSVIFDYVVGAQWLRNADPETKLEVVNLIAEAIGDLRLDAGVDELDDPLPPEMNTFLLIRSILR